MRWIALFLGCGCLCWFAACNQQTGRYYANSSLSKTYLKLKTNGKFDYQGPTANELTSGWYTQIKDTLILNSFIEDASSDDFVFDNKKWVINGHKLFPKSIDGNIDMDNYYLKINSPEARQQRKRIEQEQYLRCYSVAYALKNQHRRIGLHIFDTTWTNLPKDMFKLKRLYCLDLAISDHAQWDVILHQLTAFKQLRRLILDLNHIDTLPKSVGNLQYLEYLDLERNWLSQLPDEIAKLQTLTQLDLGVNDLISLPENISQLQNLHALNLGMNKMTKLPSGVRLLQHLQTLDISFNDFEAFPPEICGLNQLDWLSIEGNEIRVLPTCLGQLSKLRYLHLGSNELDCLPSHFEQLTDLRYLNLEQNQLSKIPEEIYGLQRLEYLHLGGNQLSSFSDQIAKLKHLRTIHLEGNPIISDSKQIKRLQELLPNVTLLLEYQDDF